MRLQKSFRDIERHHAEHGDSYSPLTGPSLQEDLSLKPFLRLTCPSSPVGAPLGFVGCGLEQLLTHLCTSAALP